MSLNETQNLEVTDILTYLVMLGGLITFFSLKKMKQIKNSSIIKKEINMEQKIKGKTHEVDFMGKIIESVSLIPIAIRKFINYDSAITDQINSIVHGISLSGRCRR